VFVCISPWNFPLAIFTGQIVAALASGNTVIAKPAEQTPLIAAFAVKLLLKAGLPKNAISLIPGDGALIGRILLNDKRVAGVAFTGSLDTASIIAQTLAMRGGAIVPFIAETGGLNAMIVDSSAHLEQAVDDVIISAFGSAGQRCSALRVLYIQENIAKEMIEQLKGAMEVLNVGSPLDFSVDIGPVIDESAHKSLSDYIYSARRKFTVLAETPENKHVENGLYFIRPIAFEINSIKDLPGEIFGPVLHIIRFKANEFERIIDEINVAGYGLTIGLQTRITSRINYLRMHANIGNMYVNRSMIGATVGVQPFGGEGLSGTGFKAGGPDYLLRFAVERCFTENTSAIGGNRELLA
jgi:RHH-type proline utilization regulon transcriptional repressor/proline dehydrogenase/delta 1-pyrroline-5-carboxylate dehydrogenase